MTKVEIDTLTVNDLLTNPPGTHSRAVAARYQIINSLYRLFSDNFKDPKKNKRFKLNVLKKTDNIFRVFGKIPSDHYKVDYDVVLDIDFKEESIAKNAEVKVFTNTPSWIFTYAYVFYNSDLIPTDLEYAIGKEAQKERPKVTNPDETLGFDKVVHQFLLYMIQIEKLWLKKSFEEHAERDKRIKFDPKSETLKFEFKLKEYNKEKKKEVEKNKKERKAKKVKTSLEKTKQLREKQKKARAARSSKKK